MKTRIAIIGYGNIGRAVEQAVLASEDLELVGIFHHNDNLDSVEADVAALCTPTRQVPDFAEKLLARGISTVDSFDIHGQIYGLRQKLMPVARNHNAISIIAAGWDPGTDSVVRTLLLAMAPNGLTYTNFGPGRSMGHTVAVKAIAGVKDALSMTIPLGTGIHRRMVYVELADGADFATVETAILNDDYFRHDETHVQQVPSVEALNNVAHGVNLIRHGVSGATHNQRFEFNMEINNPALTGQVLAACARAAVRLRNDQRFGAYTLIEIPPIYLLPGDEEQLIRSLV
ncbi:MAG: diaminopimelate dehydrogenase [Bacteroidales bacterium]|nr:diaminopimelate dehydrogenase [Bacteroidales bacterium]